MTQEKTMDIKAVKFRKDGFYSQPFVFGGEEGQEKFDMNIRYRGYLYDPAEHDGVAFEDLPDDWRCPRCKQPKTKFNKA